MILMTEPERILIYKYVAFPYQLFFQEICCTNFEEIDLHVHGKTFSIAFTLLN